MAKQVEGPGQSIDKIAIDGMKVELEPILTKLFQLMDKDENGTIGEAEGIAVGRAMQPQNPEGWWKMLLANSDNDKSNTVDLNEYIDYVCRAYTGIHAKADAARMELDMVFQKLEASLSKQAQQNTRGQA